MRHRASRKQVRARREQIHSLRSKGYNADEIYNSLKDRFPHLTLETVYADFKFLKEHSKEYIIFEYLPNFGDEFSMAVQNIHDIKGEAWSMYYQGMEEDHNIILPDGKQMKKHIKKSRFPQMLRLALDANIALINVGSMGPSVANLDMIIAENKRLKAQTEGGGKRKIAAKA